MPRSRPRPLTVRQHLIQPLTVEHQGFTSRTSMPSSRAIFTQFAVPFPPGKASRKSGAQCSSMSLLRIGPAALSWAFQSAATVIALAEALWLSFGPLPCPLVSSCGATALDHGEVMSDFHSQQVQRVPHELVVVEVPASRDHYDQLVWYDLRNHCCTSFARVGTF